LGQLLDRFLVLIMEHNPVSNFSLRRTRESVLLCRKGLPISAGWWPLEQYALWYMIDLCRMALGPDWLPARVWLQHRGVRLAQEDAWLPGVEIITGSAVTTIEIPRSLLGRRIVSSRSDEDDGPTPQQIDTQVLKLLRASPKLGGRSVHEIAEQLALTPRTLQRRLAERGGSIRRLLAQARFERAQVLLQASDCPVAVVGARAGYESPAAFTRAFRRWAGVSPSEYRTS
jgi:AraC-like DNA-binding protein